MRSLRSTTDPAAAADALRTHERFLVTTHEAPDGDALGSMLAMQLALESLGKDSVMFLTGDVPLPREYQFMPLGSLRRGSPPSDAAERVLVAVDCAKAERLGADATLVDSAPLVLNVDHHHDNTLFGDVNLIVPTASSTGEILRDVFASLGAEVTPEIAQALYIALVTDTGRFQYTNTTPRSLRLAAELVEAGAHLHQIFRDVYESVEFAKLKLLARALDHARLYDGGRLIVSYLVKQDFSDVGASEPYSEGIIDYLRAVEGAEMAVLIREPPSKDGVRKASLRSSAEGLDVSAIARKAGGGGHRQAAGFSSERSIDEITDFVRTEFEASRAAA
jgi:phosphoesterase RecJ-like protein